MLMNAKNGEGKGEIPTKCFWKENRDGRPRGTPAQPKIENKSGEIDRWGTPRGYP